MKLINGRFYIALTACKIWKDRSKAYEAYNQVDASFFVNGWEWRYELMLEQRAYCLLQSGQIEAAATHFKRLIARWSTDSSVAQDLMGTYITEAATGVLKEHLLENLSALVEREKWDWLNTTSDTTR